jgi:hypothetical protein
MVDESALHFTWTALASGSETPGFRSRHGLAYHQSEGATILFGGMVWTAGGRVRSDTWELRGGRWSRVDVGNPPPARHRSAMVQDSLRGQCVLFGGQGNEGRSWPFLGDTWTWSEQRWRRWKTWFGAEEAGLVVLFGGIDPRDRPLGDTWTFDGNSWRSVPGPGPANRRYAAFAYDPDLKGCILNGGSVDDAGREGFGDTWLFRDRTWTRLGPGFDTSVHDDQGLAYHRTAKKLVMFGGLGGSHGVLVREANGWRTARALPLPPRFQCSPLAWDEGLNGLVFHGGEVQHGGPQFDTTWVLRLSGG